jgi:hypothetical protein
MLLSAQPAVRRVQEVKTVFVAPLDGDNAAVANLVTAKLITYIAKMHGVSVVESEDKADAILTGSGLVQNITNIYGRSFYRVQAAMRLDNKDGVVLWADDITSNRFAQSASSSFAENVAKKLVQAIVGESDKAERK